MSFEDAQFLTRGRCFSWSVDFARLETVNAEVEFIVLSLQALFSAIIRLTLPAQRDKMINHAPIAILLNRFAT